MLSGGQPPQSICNPNHTLHVQPAVFLQLPPHPLAFLGSHIAVRHPQRMNAFEVIRPALQSLN